MSWPQRPESFPSSWRFIFFKVNIHTHLVPFVLWGWHATPFLSSSPLRDIPEATFTAFALLCLFASALWHTMSGCAHPAGMEFFARADYVGIGWYVKSNPLFIHRFDRLTLVCTHIVQVNQCKRWQCRALRLPVSSQDRQFFSSFLFLYWFGRECLPFHELVQPI